MNDSEVFKIISTFSLGYTCGGVRDLLVSIISAGNRLSGPALDYVASIFGRSKECYFTIVLLRPLWTTSV
jgi:hypothetical protein